MAILDLDQLVNMSAAAQIAGMKPQLFRYYVGRGETPEPIRFDGRCYFFREAITKWKKPKSTKLGRPPKQ